MSRLILKEIENDFLTLGKCRVTVSLSCNEKICIGEAASLNEYERVLKAVAEATLKAISRLLPPGVQLRLVQCGKVSLTGPAEESKMIFLVSIQMKENLSLEILTGSCPFTKIELEIAAKAVLDAVNRKLEKYI